jgi:hypothetical protein
MVRLHGLVESMPVSRFVLARVVRPIPVHNRARMRALGAKECSRDGFFRAIGKGSLAYVRRVKDTDLWMCYFTTGAVVKLDRAGTREFLRSVRDAAGRPVVDSAGTGSRLAELQNRRAGDRPARRRQPADG